MPVRIYNGVYNALHRRFGCHLSVVVLRICEIRYSQRQALLQMQATRGRARKRLSHIYMAAGVRAGIGDSSTSETSPFGMPSGKSPQSLPYMSDGAKIRRFLETAKLLRLFLFYIAEKVYFCKRIVINAK